MVITVDELIETPFRYRTRAEKVQIFTEGKPLPSQISKTVVDEISSLDNKEIVETVLDAVLYNKVDWLTACCKRNSLFCWSCLLFLVEQNQWNTVGIQKFNCLPMTMQVHEKSIEHLQSLLDMQNFRLQHTYSFCAPKLFHLNDLVRRNREIMRRIIDVICVLIIQQRPPRMGSKSRIKLKLKECLKDLEFLRDCDAKNTTMIEDATAVLKISPNIMTDIVDAMTSLVVCSIQKEIQSSTFVSLILNQHSCNDSKCQISTVLRYLQNGKVYERFVGFTNVNVNKTSNEEILHHIAEVTAQYKIQSKLIAFTFEGAVLQAKHKTAEFLNEMSSFYPTASFVPCYFHKFDDVLQQNLTNFKDCDFFFKTTRAIGSFLCENDNTREHFQTFIHRKAPSSAKLDFVNYAAFFNSLKILRRHLLDYFEYERTACKYWKADDLAQVRGFRRFLGETRMIFLLHLFSTLFALINDICPMLNRENPETVYENNLIDNLLQTLESQKRTGFNVMWGNIVNSEIDKCEEIKLIFDNRIKDHCRALFMDSINCIRNQILVRLNQFTNLEFCHLIDPAKYGTCNRIDEWLRKLNKLYGSTFDVQTMMNELKVLYANPDLMVGKCAFELLKFFNETDLKATFQNVYKLVEIIVSMPYKPPSLTNTSSKLDKINAWSYSLDEKEIEGDLCILCVELEYFLQLRESNFFYDEVIVKFQERNKSMDFLSYYQ